MFGKVDGTAAASTKSGYDPVFAEQNCVFYANPLLSGKVCQIRISCIVYNMEEDNLQLQMANL